MRAFGSLPEWIVRIPELDTYCLTAKLHTIDTEFFPDVAERELLHAMKIISDESMRRVRAALLRHLAGDFAPKQDPLPPGSIVRHRNGTERMVVANCYLGDLYRGAGTLSTTCLLERAADVPAEDRTRPVQDLVPYPEGAPKPTGFVDLVDLRSENQPRLVKKCVGEDATALNTMRAAFRTLVLGTDAGGAP
jgi:hypothetical protein